MTADSEGTIPEVARTKLREARRLIQEAAEAAIGEMPAEQRRLLAEMWFQRAIFPAAAVMALRSVFGDEIV